MTKHIIDIKDLEENEIICPDCDGSGQDLNNYYFICKLCKGEGILLEKHLPD